MIQLLIAKPWSVSSRNKHQTYNRFVKARTVAEAYLGLNPITQIIFFHLQLFRHKRYVAYRPFLH